MSISIPIPPICAAASPPGSTGWKKNGWRTANKKPVKNIELWQELEKAAAPHKVHWHWLKGHAGHPMNERADELAREGMQPFLRR